MTQELAQAMKLGMRRLAAGVSVLTCQSPDGADLAMTVSSVTSVSDNPPSLLVCVARATKMCPLLTPGQEFTVNVLGQQHQSTSTLCSTGDQGEHRFNGCEWTRESGKSPVLPDAEAAFTCQVDLVQPYGTHHIVVCRIVKVTVAGGEPKPLIYLNGGYRELS